MLNNLSVSVNLTNPAYLSVHSLSHMPALEASQNPCREVNSVPPMQGVEGPGHMKSLYKPCRPAVMSHKRRTDSARIQENQRCCDEATVSGPGVEVLGSATKSGVENAGVELKHSI
jgi:hypothetical protein|tara:strand:- start:7162 stop:7509 length:348 start_codon:yes stop_codon:yes gene_type:complete